MAQSSIEPKGYYDKGMKMIGYGNDGVYGKLIELSSNDGKDIRYMLHFPKLRGLFLEKILGYKKI
jgi:hypothetical protein